MAIIGRIRNRMGTWIVFFVGFALLAFIVNDFFMGNSSMLGNNEERNSIAMVAGKPLDRLAFDSRVSDGIENVKAQQQKTEVDAQTTDMVRDQVYNDMLREAVMSPQFEKLGLIVTDDELNDMVLGNNIDQEIIRAFSNQQTGQFMKDQIAPYLKSLNEAGTDPEKLKAKKQWVNFEKQLLKKRLDEKYNEMVKGGMFVTSEEAKTEYANRMSSSDIRAVALTYNTIVDSTVAVTDEELNKYYNENQYKYQSYDDTRSMKFISYDIQPSAEDQQMVIQDMANLSTQFLKTSNDSSFASTNSDEPPNFTYRNKGAFSPYLDSVVFNKPVGSIIGPIFENQAMRMAKVLGFKVMHDSVKVRHILLSLQNPADSAAIKNQADSLIGALKGGTPFELAAMSMSQDPGSKEKGGDLGWVTPDVGFVPEFKEATFNGKINELQLVKSQFGYHIIQITDQKNMSSRAIVAEVVRSIRPTNKTYEIVRQRANEFAGKNQTSDAFETAAKAQNLFLRPADNITSSSKFIPGLGQNCREVVQWMYNAKQGDVSTPIRVDEKYVIAILTAINNKGVKPLDNVRKEVEAEVRKQKKAQQFIEKMSGAANIDALAQKLGSMADTIPNVNFANPNIGRYGMEPNVAAIASTLKAGQTSKPVKGAQGVYVISAYKVNAAGANDGKDTKNQMMMMFGNRVYQAFESLKEKANVKDNRALFF
ncbi:MAG: peptidylprolyl isomerase [Bacteroidetes bacterium]|nr:peptidylprolyl isomerase [Bacteroidota bacterium]